MALLLVGGDADRDDPNVAGVKGASESSNCATLAGGIKALEENEQARPDALGFEQSGRRQS